MGRGRHPRSKIPLPALRETHDGLEPEVLTASDERLVYLMLAGALVFSVAILGIAGFIGYAIGSTSCSSCPPPSIVCPEHSEEEYRDALHQGF